MNRIKEVLEEKGIKQTWLDKSYNMVNGYVLNEIAEFLDIDIKDLIVSNNV